MFKLFEKLNMKQLTEKQLRIAQLLSDGLTVEEIAAERQRSIQILKEHMRKAKIGLFKPK